MIRRGNILIVQRGTIGKVALINQELGQATINPSMILLNAMKIEPSFIFQQLASFIGQSQIFNLTSQTGVPMISQEQVNNLRILVPKDSKEIGLIAEKLDGIDTIILQEEEGLSKTQSLKLGLMADLLSGRKAVGIPAEAQASLHPKTHPQYERV